MVECLFGFRSSSGRRQIDTSRIHVVQDVGTRNRYGTDYDRDDTGSIPTVHGGRRRRTRRTERERVGIARLGWSEEVQQARREGRCERPRRDDVDGGDALVHARTRRAAEEGGRGEEKG